MMEPQTRVVVITITDRAKRPSLVTNAELKHLAASVYARGLLSVSAPRSETWKDILRTAFEVHTKDFSVPSSPLVHAVLQGNAAAFGDLLKSGQGFKCQPGFPSDQTPIGSFMHHLVRESNAKFTQLLESLEADLLTPRLFLEAVRAGVAVPLLLKQKLLQKPEDFEVFFEYPSWAEGTTHAYLE
jgi:hypothetical protein